MKKTLIRIVSILALVVMLTTVLAPMALAAKGGMPAAHGVDGRTFGGAVVSFLAKNGPIALAEHVSGK